MDPYVIAVGAATGTSVFGDSVASFSNEGDGTRNPDLIAPGVGIQTLRAPGSIVDKLVPATGSASRFIKGSGTSEATALVSGNGPRCCSRSIPTSPPTRSRRT